MKYHKWMNESKMLNLDWGCVRQRYQDYIHDNPELLEVKK